MAPYKRLAIMGIEGERGGELADCITDALFRSQRFDLIDRQHVKTVAEEQGTSLSVSFSEAVVSKVGQLLTADALVFGSAKNRYAERVSRQSWQDKDGRSHTRYTRNGTAEMKASIKVIDVASAKIVATKLLLAQSARSEKATDRQPAPIDSEALYRSCMEKISSDFMKMVAPYPELVTVRLQKFKHYDEMETARAFVEQGNWMDAREVLRQVADRAEGDPKVKAVPRDLAMVHYNYGVALQYTGEFDEALRELGKAQRIMPTEQLYAEQVTKCRLDKLSAERVKAQVTGASD